MPLTSGTRLGPYEIVTPLGAGSMGEVYRARDSRLNRDVAIKILPSAFSNDPNRMARFRREAQVLAALNHSNIAAIYGVEESGSALVMELVEGPTLAERIAGGAIDVEEALAIARQIEGETVSDTLAAVLKTDPDWSRLPPETTPQLRRLLQRCLERDPKRRLRDIGDVWIDMDAPVAPTTPAATPRESRWKWTVP